MRKKAKYILASLLMFCFTTSVNAEECSYEKQVELNNIASTVKAVYEETEIDTGDIAYEEGKENPEPVKIIQRGFTIKILNITEDIFVTVENDYNNTKKDYYYRDTDKGTLTLDTFAADSVYNYVLSIGAAKGDCAGEILRTTALMVPKYNDYSQSAVCDDYPDFQYCQEYITNNEDIDAVKFERLFEEYKKTHNPINKSEQKQKNEKENKISKKQIIIAVAIIVIVMGVATSVIIIRKRSRLI